MDMAAGGEGAPLVPMSEYMIFRSETEDRILQNIGGVSNLTYLPKHASISDVTAFDTGPGNIMIDYFANRYFAIPYDDGGKIALSGTEIKEIMDFLKQDEFITRIPPKSTGREQYNRNFMEKMADELHFDNYQKEDILTTITEFTVYAMIYNYRKFISNFDTVILSGGGSHNQYIVKRMKELLSQKVITQEDLGYNSDAKEAVAFVCLGYLTLCGRPGNVIKATGAEKEIVLGKITPGNRGLKKWQSI
jgi:anhydro-N-acetylmuramic acid kinase